MTRDLVPLHKRITLLVRSRTRELLGVVGFMSCVALFTLAINEFVFWAFGILISYIAVPLALAASRRELTGAEAALWLQKPVRELRFALAGLAETIIATVSVSVLLGTICVVVGMAMGWAPERPPVLALPVGALAAFTIASMAFGTAVWLPRGSRAAVILLIVMSLYLFDPEISQPDLVRGGPIVLARIILFPAPDVVRFGLGLTGDFPFQIRPVLAMLAYSAGWIAAGALGIWQAAVRGRIGYN